MLLMVLFALLSVAMLAALVLVIALFSAWWAIALWMVLQVALCVAVLWLFSSMMSDVC